MLGRDYYIELVPANTEKSNQITIFSNASTLYIIQKTKEGKTLLMGEYYIFTAL